MDDCKGMLAVLPGWMDSSVGGRNAQLGEPGNETFTSSTPLPGLDTVMAESAMRKGAEKNYDSCGELGRAKLHDGAYQLESSLAKRG